MAISPGIKGLVVGAVGIGCITFGMTGVAQAAIVGANSIPGNFDASSGTRIITFTGAEAGFGSGIIQDLNAVINFAKADGENFDPPFPLETPYFSEVVFRLTSPNGTVANLINADSFNLGSRPFNGTITFDDLASNVVNFDPNLIQPGTFRPISPLSAFNGESALGTWTLFIQDTASQDSLRFRSVQLAVETQAIPTPALLPGLIGLGVAALRKRKAEAVEQASEV